MKEESEVKWNGVEWSGWKWMIEWNGMSSGFVGLCRAFFSV